MADPEEVKGLVRGAYDTHIHTSPDVMPRKCDDMALAKRASTVGIAGFVLKSHYVSTPDRATMLRQSFPGLQAFGGLVLNNSLGGMNPIAVEVAGRLGTKVVWLPTVDAANEHAHITNPQDPRLAILRAMRARSIPDEAITVTGEDGDVTEATRQCLELIAEHDMVLATGHVSYREIQAVVKAAAEAKVLRILITHPESPATFLTLPQQRELLKYGVLFERCFLSGLIGTPWETMYAGIRQLGPSATILATDLGQPNNPWPDEGLGLFFGKLLDAGFTPAEIEVMSHKNPAQLLGAPAVSAR